MIGVYDYTVLITYLSAISAGLGMIVTMSGSGLPYEGCLFLLFCGLCDGFDGKVARTKKNRTEYDKNFGLQIDSLCDILSFGLLPVAIGAALIRTGTLGDGMKILFYGIMMLYLVFGIARLAHFNVVEEERQQTEKGNRRYFRGIPVTISGLIFPTVLFFQCIVSVDLTVVYFALMLLTAVGFVLDIRIPKSNTRALIVMSLLGAAEFIFLLVNRLGV